MRALPFLLAALLPGCSLLWPQPVEVVHHEVVTDSGVRYVDFLAGQGPAVVADSVVTIDYTAKLPDGTVIDSTSDRGIPVTFQMGEAPIEGWNHGLLGMRAGGRRTLVVPASLAYGEEGVPGLVPPGATLLFEVELLTVGAGGAPD